MDEQSHKAEMRAALQGDFERLRARRRVESPGVGDEARIPVSEGCAEYVSSAAEPERRDRSSRWFAWRR